MLECMGKVLHTNCKYFLNSYVSVVCFWFVWLKDCRDICEHMVSVIPDGPVLDIHHSYCKWRGQFEGGFLFLYVLPMYFLY